MSNFLVWARENAINDAIAGDAWIIQGSSTITSTIDALSQAKTAYSALGDFWTVGLGSTTNKFTVFDRAVEPTVTQIDDSNPDAPWPTHIDPPDPKTVEGLQWTAEKKPFLYFIYARGTPIPGALSEGYLIWEFDFDHAIRRGTAMFDLMGDYWIQKAAHLPHKGHIPPVGSNRLIYMNIWSDEL